MVSFLDYRRPWTGHNTKCVLVGNELSYHSPGLSEVGEHETEGGAHSVVVSSEGITWEVFDGIKLVADVFPVVYALQFLQSRLAGRVVVEMVQVATAHWRSAGHSSAGVRQVSHEFHRRHSERNVCDRVGNTLEEDGI